MRPEVWQASAASASTAGIAGLFLPSVEQAWDANPEDFFFAHKLDNGFGVYLLVVGISGTLQSLAVRSVVPLIVAALIAGIVIANYSMAFDTSRHEVDPKTKEAA